MTSALILFLFLFALGVLAWGHWRPTEFDDLDRDRLGL